MRFAWILAVLATASAALADRPVTITFLHNNDLHSHIEPTIISRKPFGGYARIATLLKRFRAQDPNPIFLNGGDTCQGTLFYNVYEGMADVALLNAMGLDAMAAGNHEFDRGPKVFADFIKAATFPILSANVDAEADPDLKGLMKPSVVVTIGGEKLGIVGAMTPDLPEISSPGPNVKMKDLVSSLQAEVDKLTAEGVNKIVVVSHCGYGVERDYASKLRNVDIVIGGHSHTPLGTPELPGWPASRGPYPTVVKDATGRDVYVVQAWEWGKVLGRFKVDFDAKGEIVRFYDAAPIVVDETIPEDPVIASMVAAFKKPIAELQEQPIGNTANGISRDPIAGGERLMGNVLADAMLAATAGQGAVAAFTNSGGVRSSIEAGVITYGEAIAVAPFSNTLVILTLTGAELRAALEHGLTGGGLLLPSKGTSYKAQGGKITEAIIGGQPLDDTKTYKLCFNSFTASGGDGHNVLKNAPGARTDTGIVDIDALVDFIKKNTPLDPKPEGRIVVRG